MDRGKFADHNRLQGSRQVLPGHHVQIGVPNSIITDNGTNFTGHYFQEFAEGYGIRIDWASVGHPRTNGQVERANGLILQGLKPCIFDMLKKFAGRWVEELLAVL